MAKLKGNNAGPKKWKKLTHNGPAFPPPFKRLPKTISLRYGGRPVKSLSSMAEEAVVLFAKIFISSPREAQDKRFRENFFEDFQKLLTSKQQKQIVSFRSLNFGKIVTHLKRLESTEKTSQMIRQQKRKTEALKLKHGVCKVDGKDQPVGNFMVEPPAIFRGRGDNPRRGRIKLRVNPKDVIINCSNGVRVNPPRNSRWNSIVHDQTASWLARYTNSLGETKYVQLGQSSKLKSDSDRDKYEVARGLQKTIGKIRQTYQKNFSSKDEKKRQIAVALYLIDNFSLRVGHEKGADAADTVGCCTLRKHHIVFKGSNKIQLDFLGKDSIRFKKELKVTPKVVSLLKSFTRNKAKRDKLFDVLSAHDLNQYLKELSPRLLLTAKSFRTYHASLLLQKELMKAKKSNKSQAALLAIFNQANLQVAKLCNHKKAVGKNFKKALKKLKDRLTSSDEKLRLLTKKYNELKSQREKTDRVLTQIQNEKERNITLKSKLELQTEGKEFALNTSKQNYIDPRITIAWCQKHNVPLNKVFSKAMLNKYKWAVDEIQRRRGSNFRF